MITEFHVPNFQYTSIFEKDFWEDGDLKYIRATVPIPDECNTELSGSLRSLGIHNFIDINIDIKVNTIELTRFIVFAQIGQYDATDDEKREFRGMGKKILCLLLIEIVENSHINPTMNILLTARNLNSCNVLQPIVREHIIQSFYRTGGDIQTKQKLISARGLRGAHDSILCDYINQQKLVSYYITLGFRLLVSKPFAESNRMVATIEEIMTNC